MSWLLGRGIVLLCFFDAMGKWDEYVVCGNPKCRPHGPKGHLSWRRISRGPDACIYCNTPFRCPVSKSPGGSGGKGGGGDAGWSYKDGKGRTRPLVQARSADDDEVAIAKALRNLCKGDDNKLTAAELALQTICPPKPKSEDEIFKEAKGVVEKALQAKHHQAKVAEDMRRKYQKDCIALVEYKKGLDQQLENLREADAKLNQARQQLLEIQSVQLNRTAVAQGATVVPIDKDKDQFVTSAVEVFASNIQMPTVSERDLSESLANVEVVRNKLGAEDATALQRSLAQIFERVTQGLQKSVRDAAAAAFSATIPEQLSNPRVQFGTVEVDASDGIPGLDAAIAAADLSTAGGVVGGQGGDVSQGLGLSDLEMDERDSVKRFGTAEEGDNDDSGRSVRVRLAHKQVASAPQSAQLSEADLQAVCGKALQQASEVCEKAVAADSGAATAAGSNAGSCS